MQRSAIEAAGYNFRTKNISQRAQSIVISPIKEMSILADEWQEKTGANIISFGQGIPYFDTPDYIKEGIKKALNEISTAKYTLEPGITELRELIGKDLLKRKNITVNPKKEIMVSAGCQEAVACAIATVIDSGDEVILFSPGFASHIEQTIQFGGVPVFVPLIEEREWVIDFDKLEKSITPKTKVILFSNPCNPTGSVLNKEEIKHLSKFALSHDLIIISDETYDFLLYDNLKHFSPASLPEIKDRVIVCSSFSKKYALTGYRIGFAYTNEGILAHMLKIHDALTICAPAISQKAAMAALRGNQDSVLEFIDKLTYNRESMCSKLNELKDIFEYVKPRGAYYIFAKYSEDISSFDLALKLLKETGVVTIPGAAFGPTGEGHLRFSFACSPKEVEEGFNRLDKYYGKM